MQYSITLVHDQMGLDHILAKEVELCVMEVLALEAKQQTLAQCLNKNNEQVMSKVHGAHSNYT